MGFFDRFRRRSAPPVTPQFDDAVAKRLEAAGKRPDRVQAVPAEATAIPKKPDLPGFTGTVKLEVTLDEQGAVRAVAMDGAPASAVAELEAWAHAWSFRPAAMDGKPHPCRMVFEVTWS